MSDLPYEHPAGSTVLRNAMRKQTSAQDRIIIFSLWLLVFAASSQIMIISPLLPRISEALDTSKALLGNLASAYAVMVGICALITGPFSDKIGRRRILKYGTGFMAAALFLHALADSFWMLFAFRALAGVAGGILSGSAVAYVGDYFVYEKRGWASGWVMSGIAMGQILGVPLGTVLAEQLGFRWAFIAFGIVMAAAFFLIHTKVPQPDIRLYDGRITLKGSLRKYLVLLSRSSVRAAALAHLFMFLSMSVYIVFLPTWLEEKFQVSGMAIASLFFIGGIANVMTGPQAGRLSDLIGRKGMILISCAGFAIIMVSTTLVVHQFWVAYPLFFLTMILIAMRISPLQALTTALVPDNRRGATMSLMMAIGQMGYGLGGSIAGPAFAYAGYLSNTLIGAFFILGMGFTVWKFIPEPRMRAIKEEEQEEAA